MLVNEQFLLFPLCFQKTYTAGLVWERVNFLPNDKTVDQSKKAFADDKSNLEIATSFVKARKHYGKEENAGHQLSCLQTLSISGSLKVGIVWLRVNSILNICQPFPNKPLFLHVYSTSLLMTLWEKKKLLVTSNFSFSTVFSTILENSLPVSSNSKLSSANSFSLEESKVCRLGKVYERRKFRPLQIKSNGRDKTILPQLQVL